MIKSNKKNDKNTKLTGKQRSLANLITPKKGEVRNPHGRPKKEVCLTSIVKAELDEIMQTKDGDKLTKVQILGKALVNQAIKGNMTAVSMIWDRIEGKVMQVFEGNFNINSLEEEIRNMSPEERKKRLDEILQCKKKKI